MFRLNHGVFQILATSFHLVHSYSDRKSLFPTMALKWAGDLRAGQSNRLAVALHGAQLCLQLPHLGRLTEKQPSYLLCFSDILLELSSYTAWLK